MKIKIKTTMISQPIEKSNWITEAKKRRRWWWLKKYIVRMQIKYYRLKRLITTRV